MEIVSIISLWFIPILIGFILLYGTYKKVPTYESFVEGGKEGIKIAVSIIPFLVGMLVAISIFRASGALEFFMNLIRPLRRLLEFQQKLFHSQSSVLFQELQPSG